MKKIVFIVVLLQVIIFAKQISYETKPNVFKKANSTYLLEGKELKLKFSVKNAKSIKWYQIIPNISKFYKNANFPWDPKPYQWAGFGKIEYEKVEIKEFENQKIVTITQKILEKNRPQGYTLYNSKVGSFWFQAVATKNSGKTIKSTGLKQNNSRGLSPKVFRVSFMKSDDYIGYLTTFSNVPGIFGSIPYQSKNYIGVDCADVLMAVSSIITKKKLKDFNVAMLVTKLKKRASLHIKEGKPSKKLIWGKDFKKGDFIAVRYSPKSQFAHIGLLYEDSNRDGILDSGDFVIHTGPEALHISTLDVGVFDGFVKILKNRDMKKKAIGNRQ